MIEIVGLHSNLFICTNLNTNLSNPPALSHFFTTTHRRQPWTGQHRLTTHMLQSRHGDEIHDDLIAFVEIDNAIDGLEYVLSDPTFYNFELTDANNNENWSLIFDILLELVGLPNLDEQHAHDASIQSAIIKFHAVDAAIAADTTADANADANTDPSTPIPNNPTLDFIKRTREYYPADQVRAQVLKAMQSSIHKACVVNYLVVEDKDAFVLNAGATAEDMRLQLLFLNARGRIVRETRIDDQTAEILRGS